MSEGASQQEILIAACRSNNTSLLHQVLSNPPANLSLADFLNETRDPLGNTPLHLTATYSSVECLDILLDQEGLEVDPITRIEAETPLHLAAKNLSKPDERQDATSCLELLVDAGADPRIKNKHNEKAVDYVPGDLEEVRWLLQKADVSYSMSNVNGADVASEDEGGPGGYGSASDDE
ncbi:hypothetical protein YB2330_004927 [Saitoella coloradoensis]